MALHPLTTEMINSVIEQQLDLWPEARDNFFRLREAERRALVLEDLAGAVQHNPARIRSTGASVDAVSVAARPCFLCSDNRPSCQVSFEWPEGWDFLVNPYPVLPVHFTIASKTHRPQDRIPLDIAVMAEAAPDLTFFFNGARAGASAPDHMHVQAVLKTELPLIRIAESFHPDHRHGFMTSAESGLSLPFQFISAVITPDATGMKTLALAHHAFGIDADTGEADQGLVNAFFWTGDSGLLRCIVVPRRRHRPSCFHSEGRERFLISPGAIDMAGLVITPRREDFERLDADIMKAIYGEVDFADKLPTPVLKHFML